MTKSYSKTTGNVSWFGMCTYRNRNCISMWGLASFWVNQPFYFLTWYSPTLVFSIHPVKNWGFLFFNSLSVLLLSRVTSSSRNVQPIALLSTLQNRWFYPCFTAAEQWHIAASTRTVKQCPLIPEIWNQFVWVVCFFLLLSISIVAALFMFNTQINLTSVTALRTQHLPEFAHR